MKLVSVAGALVAASVALPAAAQNWYDPAAIIHNSYVEVEGGASVQGRSKIKIEAVGLGSSAQSASQDDQAFGGALIGYKLAEGVAIEGEGVYARNHLPFSPANAVFGVGGAVRTYGGMGNLRFSLPSPPSYNLPIAGHTLAIGVSPYVSPGIGYGEVDYTGRNGVFSYDDQKDGFLWQGKAGVEIRTGRHIAFDIAYRYLQSPDFNRPGYFNSSRYSAMTQTHLQAVTAGLKYYF